MAGDLRHRAVLPVAGHPPVDEARIAGADVARADAESLHHPRAKALDQGVGVLAEPEQRLTAVGGLEVDRDRLAAPPRRVLGGNDGGGCRALDAQHVGAHVGQQHARERRRADPADLQHPDVGEGALARSRSWGRLSLAASIPSRSDMKTYVPGILDRFTLDGKVAVVTGASSGLGVAFAVGLAGAGADIAICARRADRLAQTERAVQETGRRCVAIEADVARPEDCRRVVERTLEELGHVDVLINNAGIGTAVAALRETPEDFRRVIDVTSTAATSWRRRARPRCAREAAGASSTSARSSA